MCIWDSYVYQKGVLCFLIDECYIMSVKTYCFVCKYAAVPVQIEIEYYYFFFLVVFGRAGVRLLSPRPFVLTEIVRGFLQSLQSHVMIVGVSSYLPCPPLLRKSPSTNYPNIRHAIV